MDTALHLRCIDGVEPYGVAVGVAFASCADGGGCDGGATICQEYLPVLADRVDVASRAGNGNVIQVNTTFPQVRDARGRSAHGVDMLIVASARYTTATTATITPDMQLSLLNNITIRDVSGHEYCRGALDWRQLRDDMLIRDAGAVPIAAPASYAATVTTSVTATATIQFYHRWADKDGEGFFEKDASIPLAALRAYGADAITLQVASDFAPTLAGATWTGFTGTMDIYMGIVYWDDPYVDAGWIVKQYTLNENSRNLLDCDRLTEYAFLNPNAGDTGGADVDGYSNINVQHGSMVWKNGLTLDRSRYLDVLTFLNRNDVDLTALGLSSASTIRRMALAAYQRNRKGSVRGQIAYSWDRTGYDYNRFLHRTIAAMTPDRDQKIRAAMGALSGTREKVATYNPAVGAGSALRPFLPRKVEKA